MRTTSRQKPQSKDSQGVQFDETLHLYAQNSTNTNHKAIDSNATTNFKHSFSNMHLQAGGPVVQTKLSVNEAGDKYEQEADAMAEKVMLADEDASIQRKPVLAEITPVMQAREESDGMVSQSLSNTIALSQGKGNNMDSSTQSFMSEKFSADFSKVKIHTNHEAARMNSELNALAFTVGNDIYFNDRQYQPGSLAGRGLLAHELTHTVQQGNGIRLKLMPKDLSGRPLGFFPTPEQENYDKESAEIRERLLELLRKGFPGTKGNTYLLKQIEIKFEKGTDDYWLAMNLLNFGPETLWPTALLPELHTRAKKNGWNYSEGVIETTGGKQHIDSYYFTGQTDNRALIIGGVHGSELSGSQVVSILIEKLKNGPVPYYTVIVVPSLFPGNAEVAKANPAKIETGENIGRYTKGSESDDHSTDPNRQFPAFGKSFDPASKQDAKGRLIEPENIALLELIDRFKPTRIASLHSTHTLTSAGIYADPRTDADGKSLGYDSDKNLAMDMATAANAGGAKVPGNKVVKGKATNSIYPLDAPAVAAGKQQKRETTKGNSFGGWGSTAVSDPSRPASNRPAMRVFTIEVQTARRDIDVDKSKQAMRLAEFEALANVIRDIFLGPNQEEM